MGWGELRVAGINERIDFAFEVPGYQDGGWVAPFAQTAKVIEKTFEVVELLGHGRCR
jgi:hypothetical protein